MNVPILDLSYLQEMSEADLYEVLTLFIETFPVGLGNLEHLVRETDDFDAIHKQAHTLKSSAGVVRIRSTFDDLSRIDMLARNKGSKEEMVQRLNNILFHYAKAIPYIQAERARCKAAESNP
jgi:chemotaxis protein histidine kinase CheA